MKYALIRKESENNMKLHQIVFLYVYIYIARLPESVDLGSTFAVERVSAIALTRNELKLCEVVADYSTFPKGDAIKQQKNSETTKIDSSKVV